MQEKYNPTHVCKNRQFRLIIMEEEEEGDPRSLQGEDKEEERGKFHQLSPHSIGGFTTRKSLKLWGKIKNKKVIVLIDCGATHNFISLKLVKELRLKVTPTGLYSVEVGDGHKVRCQGVCRSLPIELQDLQITQNCYLFELGGVDLVLGMEWLAGLGAIEANFEKLTLTVPMQNKKVLLKAEPELIKAAISMKMIKGTMLESDQGFVVELKWVEGEKGREAVPDLVVQLLTQFEQVFQEPQGLPPHQERDHAITIQEGTKILNLRPYKYPNSHG